MEMPRISTRPIRQITTPDNFLHATHHSMRLPISNHRRSLYILPAGVDTIARAKIGRTLLASERRPSPSHRHPRRAGSTTETSQLQVRSTFRFDHTCIFPSIPTRDLSRYFYSATSSPVTQAKGTSENTQRCERLGIGRNIDQVREREYRSCK